MMNLTLKKVIIETEELTIIADEILMVRLDREDNSVSIQYYVEDEFDDESIDCSSEKEAEKLYKDIIRQTKAFYV